MKDEYEMVQIRHICNKMNMKCLLLLLFSWLLEVHQQPNNLSMHECNKQSEVELDVSLPGEYKGYVRPCSSKRNEIDNYSNQNR